jgi:hypothetical protein
MRAASTVVTFVTFVTVVTSARMLVLATALLALPGCVLPFAGDPGVSTDIAPTNASGGHQADAAKKLVNVLVIGEPIDSSVTTRSANGLVQDKQGFWLGITNPDLFPFALPHAAN